MAKYHTNHALLLQRCGRSLSGTISTARKVRYEQWLSAHNGERSSQRSTGLPSSIGEEIDLGLPTASGSSNDTSSIPLSLNRYSSGAAGTGRGNSASEQNRTANGRYLLLCVNSGTLRQRLEPLRPTVVRPVPVATGDKDEQIFENLSKMYHQTRGFWGKVSLYVVSEIRYVKVS